MEYAEYGFVASDGLDETSSASLIDPTSMLRTLEYILRKPSTSSISWEVTLRFPLVARSKYVYVRELPIANRDLVTLLDIVYYEHAPCLEGCRRVILVPFEPWTLRARMPLCGAVSACIFRLGDIRVSYLASSGGNEAEHLPYDNHPPKCWVSFPVRDVERL